MRFHFPFLLLLCRLCPQPKNRIERAANSMDIDTFIERWEGSGGSERANFQSFANDLCDVLGVERPKPATEEASADAYRFERPVTMQHTGTQSHGFIDLYRAGHFVMEAKQGVAAKSALADRPVSSIGAHRI